jgi:hypothetical protein
MFLTELFEQQTTKHASFCFGRMNPPTVGHGQLIDTVAKASQGGDYFIFVSQTQDKKKNPLDYATKVKFVKALFPKHAGHVVYNPELKTIMQVANWLYSKGYRSVTFVAGSDRLADFKELLTKYNGQPDGYNFDSINFVSSGDRDPDADGIAGVSASSAREAAAAGNFELFAQATGAGKLAQPLYDAVRKGMLIEHIVKHGSGYRILSKKTGKNMGTFPTKAAAEKHEREIQYFKHINEAHQHTEVIKHRVGEWVVYLDNHSITRAMTRGIGPRMTSNLVTAVAMIPNLEDKVPVGGAFWIKDIKTNSSLYFKRLNVPSEPLAVRCETAVKDEPRAGSRTSVFTVNAYTGPERPEHQKFMAHLKHLSRFTGINPLASKVSQGIQQGKMGDNPELIRNPDTQDSHRYDRAFKQAGKMDKVEECASGYIPKNKKEARDPRWSNALTVDVHPDTPNKNMKALGLI